MNSKTVITALLLSCLLGSAALACPTRRQNKDNAQTPPKSREERFRGLLNSLPGLRKMNFLLVQQKPAAQKPIA